MILRQFNFASIYFIRLRLRFERLFQIDKMTLTAELFQHKKKLFLQMETD